MGGTYSRLPVGRHGGRVLHTLVFVDEATEQIVCRSERQSSRAEEERKVLRLPVYVAVAC